MKKLLIILGLLITLGAGAQVKVLGYVVPNSTSDNYPTHLDIYGAGGFRSVATLAERDAISTLRRRAGMLVYVVATSATYQLGNDLTTWNVPNVGGGAVGGKNYYAGWGLILEDTVFRVDTALLAAAGIGSGGGGGGGGGTLTSFSFVNSTGVTGVVTNAFTTPSLKLAIDTNFFVTNSRLTTTVNNLVNNYFGDTTINNYDSTINPGDSIVISDSQPWYRINPAIALSSVAVVLPANPFNGKEQIITFGGVLKQGSVVVSNISIRANNNQEILQATTPAQVEAGESIKYKFSSSDKIWHRLQ